MTDHIATDRAAIDAAAGTVGHIADDLTSAATPVTEAVTDAMAAPLHDGVTESPAVAAMQSVAAHLHTTGADAAAAITSATTVAKNWDDGIADITADGAAAITTQGSAR